MKWRLKSNGFASASRSSNGGERFSIVSVVVDVAINNREGSGGVKVFDFNKF